MTVDLARIEAVLDDSGLAPRIEAKLPIGVRRRQLCVRTLFVGMLLCQAEGRPAHLTRVRAGLLGLKEPDRLRLGVEVDWHGRPHELSYRQVERTFGLVAASLSKQTPDGAPAKILQVEVDAFLEASLEAPFKEASRSLAIDWTDIESFSTRRTKPDGTYADEEASWGHRKGGGPGEKDELFFARTHRLELPTLAGSNRRLGRAPATVAPAPTGRPQGRPNLNMPNLNMMVSGRYRRGAMSSEHSP